MTDFIREYETELATCDRLVDLFATCNQRGLVRRGQVGGALGKPVVDTEVKDSYDLKLSEIPRAMWEEYAVNRYLDLLIGHTADYVNRYGVQHGPFGLAESPRLQFYAPGGGFKKPHCERNTYSVTTRMLVWMTYLNDVTDGGGTYFVHQDLLVQARRGRTLIWPSDFTHVHQGIVSPSQQKLIITGWFNYTQ